MNCNQSNGCVNTHDSQCWESLRYRDLYGETGVLCEDWVNSILREVV
jgi:hypothetical protein